MKKIKPFLKWAGSKYRCLDNVLASLPKAHRMIEPFAGSAAVFINTNYPCYLLADANKDLMALFHHLRQEGTTFIDYCERLFHANNSSQKYYQLRERFNVCVNSRQRAALFLYLNRHGFNGLCRYNQKGIYNVPFGRYSKPYFPREEMLLFQEKSLQAEFANTDFRETFKKALPGDVIYCDPPYSPLVQNSNFSTYTNKKFGEEEHILLATLAMEHAKRGITVVISNHDTPFTRHHYRSGTIKSFPVRRSISCNGNRRMTVQELLVVFS